MKKQPKIVFVSDDHCQVSLNVGVADGISIGDKFLIYSISDHEIIDPDTKESLGFLEFVKGTGKVTHVQEHLCTISSDSYKKPRKIITKKVPNSISTFLSTDYSTKEETVIDGELEQLPFDDPVNGDFAKKIG